MHILVQKKLFILPRHWKMRENFSCKSVGKWLFKESYFKRSVFFWSLDELWLGKDEKISIWAHIQGNMYFYTGRLACLKLSLIVLSGTGVHTENYAYV